MLKINLLSPEDKETLRWEKNNIKIRSLIFATVAMALSLLVVFGAALQYLIIQQEAAETELVTLRNQPDTKEAMEMNQRLAEFAVEAREMLKVDDMQLRWTIMTDELARLQGDGVKFESVTAKPADSKDKNRPGDSFKVELSGKALARKHLLSLEDGLKNSKVFEKLETNDANYVNAENVEFSYAFYITKKTLTDKNLLKP